MIAATDDVREHGSDGGQIKNLWVPRDDCTGKGVASSFVPRSLFVRDMTGALEDRARERGSEQRPFFHRKHCVRGVDNHTGYVNRSRRKIVPAT